MKRVFIAAAIILGTATPASAAVSGYYDAGEQIQTITQNAEVGNALRQLPFDSITVVSRGDNGKVSWRIQNSECAATVELEQIRPSGGMVGKTTYQVTAVSACQTPG